ncbi:50S ribosomal protein L25 [bacterium]|nr:50S ribosomal protein L25 [bacterium]
MAVAELKVEKRAGGSRLETKELRRHGKIPAVYYASDAEPMMLTVDQLIFQRLISHDVNVIDLVLEGSKNRKCIIRDIQKDPVTEKVVHIDFMGVKLDVEVTLTIPVILHGTPVGVKDAGGILEHSQRLIEVKGLPLEIPEHVEIDVSQLNVGDSIHVRDLKLDKVEIITDPDQDLATVVLPKKVAEPVAEELAEGAVGEEGVAGEAARAAEEPETE